MRLNINADLGEGHGAYDIGDDAALLDVVASANVACGFHAGDPTVMRRTLEAAKARGVSVGAHPGFPDLGGFGRRRIEMDPHELENAVAYQIGALMALATLVGVEVTHVKAHGALSNMAATRDDYAMAIGRAIRGVDPKLRYLALAGSAMERAAGELGLPLVREAFADRHYDDEGNLASRALAGTVIRDPAEAAARVVAMAREGAIVAMSGRRLPVAFDSLCVHGDEPTAVAVARACRKALEDAGVEIAPIPAFA
ncbi:MAG TPA: 5-oxoprolinase subunit PxpA [Paracoccaceae bacterium]|nr:5-oxoprolinase subunit PxpA [Paracoccaceae bacterium]